MQANAPAKQGLSLELRRTYSHSAERVFRALTDPQKIMVWFAPPGCEMLSVDAAAKPGGRYTIRLRKPGIEAYCVTGVYTKVEPYRLLEFTWRWVDLPGYEEETVVTIQLAAAEGGTELILTQEGFVGDPQRQGHEHGWTGGLGNLGTLLDSMEAAR